MSNTQVRHIENFWKQKTVDSNALFNQNKFLEALHGYTEAHVVAETLNVNYLDALKAEIPLLQVFVISCNNLANTYEELGRLEEAETHLQRAVYFLLHCSRHRNMDAIEIQSELRRAVFTYTQFAEKHQIDRGNHEEAIGAIKEVLI